MIIEQKTFEDGSSFALWEVTEEPDGLLEMLDNDPFVIEKISSFTSIKRKCEFLASRCTLNSVTGEKNTISYKETGKPFVEGKNLNISISHTGNWVTILTHPERNVGIDIERLTDKLVRVKTKFLSDTELSFIDSRNEKPQLAIMWAAKEALYKLIDLPGLDPVNDLHIDKFTPYLEGKITATETKTADRHSYTLHYLVRPEYVLVRVVE
ncbi:MAG: 4'-phosphopantetheinyl transferase superfamily protein [Paludibacteraceae bacterium]|nr:4'-phosphopantetheinyl transferase superfamily protein [Paludibacteraceae bacterium]